MSKSSTDSAQSFEASLQELETLISRMSQQQFGLADLVAQYQRGVELIQTCRTTLSKAQEEVQQLDLRLQNDCSAHDATPNVTANATRIKKATPPHES